MKQVDSIIFDLDGTLVDSKEDIIKAVNHTLSFLGLKKKTFNQIVSYIGRGLNDLLKKSIGPEYKDVFAKGRKFFEQYYKTHSTDSTELYPSVRDVLEYYKDKKLFIVTNRRTEMAETTLKFFDIYKYFKAVIGDDGRGCLKPSTCPLLKVVDGFNLNNQKAVMVGDMDIDVLAGKNINITTCAVTYGIGKREDLLKARPDFIINDIIELKYLFS